MIASGRRVGRLWAWVTGITLASFPVYAQNKPSVTVTAQPSVAKIYTKNTIFKLPVQVDASLRPKVSKLKFYVKPPNGTWTCAETAPVTQTSFNYKVDRDGEYWFTFATVDYNNKQTPANLDQDPPHRIVVVDTVAPQVTIEPTRQANGELILQAQIKDQAPEPTSLKLIYSTDSINWTALEAISGEPTGMFRVPNPNVLQSTIRATAMDRAGNSTSQVIDLKQQRANLEPATLPTLMPVPTDSSVKNTSYPKPPLLKEESLTEDPRPTMPVSFRPKEEDKSPSSIDPIPPIPGIPTNDPQVPNSTMDLKLPPPPGPISNELPKPLPEMNKDPVSEIKPISKDLNLDLKPITKELNPEPKAVKKDLQMDSKPILVDKPKEMLPDLNLAPANVALINTTRCNLEYVVEGVGQGAAVRIDFWVIRENGKNWMRLTDEARGRSPAQLLLPGEGIHGIVIRTNSNGQPPTAEDKPDCFVEVDMTKPFVNLLPAAVGTGVDAGTVNILYTVHDKNLINDSIHLWYSTRMDGPWMPIVQNAKNDGSYRWALPVGIGPQVYLRLEASDRAGNIARCESREPILLETAKPKAKVLSISGARQ